jgi:hypothetical protein
MGDPDEVFASGTRAIDAAESAIDEAAAHFVFAGVEAPVAQMLQDQHAQNAYFGDRERVDCSIVNAVIGDGDRSGATLGGRSAVELALRSPRGTF